MPSLPELSGDIGKDLSPLTGNIAQDFATPATSPLAPKPPTGSMGVPADAQQRFERPFGLPQIPTAPASFAVPGAGSLLGRVGLQAGAGAMERFAGGQGPVSAAKGALEGAAGALGGEAVGKGIQKLPTLTKGLLGYAETVASKAAAHLKSEVPVLGQFADNARGLKQMLYGTRGYKAVHDMYDAYLNGVVTQATKSKATIHVPEDIAHTLGVEVPKELLGTRVSVPVSAAAAAKAVVGKSKSLPEAYRAVTRALDEQGLGDPKIRRAYKAWVGARERLSGTLEGGQLDLLKAQKGAVKPKTADVLNRRDLGEMADILDTAVTKGSAALPGAGLGAVLGGLAGGAEGGHLGGLGGVAGGAYLGKHIGQRIPLYRGVPSGPLKKAAGALAPRVGATAAEQTGP